MKELIESALAGDLKDLAGLELSGTIPIKQELVNDAIAEALEKGVPEKKPDAPKVSVNALLPHVKKAFVTASEGKLTFTFEIKIDA